MDKYFYKELEFDAAVFKTYNQLYLSAKNAEFYNKLILALKSIPNNPKKYKKYLLLPPSNILKNNVSRKVVSFKYICFVYKDLNNYQDDRAISIIENNRNITFEYTDNFVLEIEKRIGDLVWDSVYGEIDVEGVIFCPNWWKSVT